ncbi:follistatin-related protein 5-like isoform X2 [Cimex lectularius]|uniref:Follistatin-related protein 5 n=1 Tax=Cimex lectularius TaxID=79782 RepID=A0A8I6RIE9_CIMLE|nr:follistatin-related protein 5-like isoform X2 [Cimex lectularius]
MEFLWLSLLLTLVAPSQQARFMWSKSLKDGDENIGRGTVSTDGPLNVDYDETNPSSITEQNPCLVKYCAKGQECRVRSGVARCVCVDDCPHHKSPVCGSDGKLYENHCSLHRASCLQGERIAVDHSFTCLQKDEITERSAVEMSSTEASTAKTPPPEMDILTDDDGNEDKTPECSLQRYDIMKDNLLKQSKSTSEERVRTGKEYLVSTMFTYYDLNRDDHLDKDELQKISDQEHLNTLSDGCTLSDMLRYDDSDQDGLLSVNEFYSAFSKLYSLSVVSLDKALEVNHLSARVGDNVEIKCDVSGTPPPPLVWRRNDQDLALLTEEDVRVFADGSLYLTRIQLLHAGNYTCHAQRNTDITQTHVLTVHTIPEVKVTPRIQSRRPGEEASMFCHVIGEPFPKVEWLKNDEPLKLNPGNNKYILIGNGTELRVHNIAYADTGAYMCQATNIGGVTRDISSLIVQEEPTPTPNEERRFFAFHDWGVSVYEPNACRLYHQIQSTDIIPGTQEYVCGDKGVNCSWGQAINVANRYVYVTQPMKDRVLVISKIQMVVVDVVVTDKRPVALHYVSHLDQVWVLNWRSRTNQGVKTIQVIRDASQKRKHHTVHPEPIDGQFDLVKDLFMPPIQDMSHVFQYGYVSHSNQRGLYKLDLANMRYVRSIDLAPYNCVPRSMQFSALYGFVILECEEAVTGRPTGQLVMDALTDSIISQKPELTGVPKIAPNSRTIVNVYSTSTGVTLVVQSITETGLKYMFDVNTTLNISDITFYPSQTTHGYDLYASSVDKEDILFLNLLTGKVEMITGVGKAMEPSLAQWGNPNRVIAASGVFGHFMVTPANEALFVVNGESRTVNCEIGGLVHPRAVVWVTMHLQ